MSDGNFKRSLLPYNDFRSGYKAGAAQMKQKAVLAFQSLFEESCESLNEVDRQQLLSLFLHKLNQ